MRPLRLAAGVLLLGALVAYLADVDGQVVQTLIAFGLAAAVIELRLVLADRRRGAGGGKASTGTKGAPTAEGGSKGAGPAKGRGKGGGKGEGPTKGDRKAGGCGKGDGARGSRRGRAGADGPDAGSKGGRGAQGGGDPAASAPDSGPSLLLERGSRSLVERAIGSEEALVIDTAAIDDASEPEHRTGVLVRVRPTGASLRFERRVDPASGGGAEVTSGQADLDAAYRILAAHEDAGVPVPAAAGRELVAWAGEEVEAELSDDLLLLRLPHVVDEGRWGDLEDAGQRLAHAFRGETG